MVGQDWSMATTNPLRVNDVSGSDTRLLMCRLLAGFCWVMALLSLPQPSVGMALSVIGHLGCQGLRWVEQHEHQKNGLDWGDERLALTLPCRVAFVAMVFAVLVGGLG